MARLRVDGVTATDVREALPTVSKVFAVVPVAVCVAVMSTVPGAIPVTFPVASTVAIVAFVVVHVTAPRSGKFVPSLNVPVAFSVTDEATAILLTGGVRAIDTSAADVTVNVAVPETPLAVSLARTVATPAFNAVTTPDALTAATVGSLTDHSTPLVSVFDLPCSPCSETVAWKTCCTVGGTFDFGGVTASTAVVKADDVAPSTSDFESSRPHPERTVRSATRNTMAARARTAARLSMINRLVLCYGPVFVASG